MQPSVSIIVPVYNVEGYLQKCLDSLVRQTLKDIEVIVVDDGSTDNSFHVAAEYANQDNRIKLIQQENCGVSGARNAGLEAAAGEYIGFVDPDDWTEPGMFETMYKQAKQDQADFCACDYTLAFDDRSVSGVLGLKTEQLDIHTYGLDKVWNEKKYAVVVWNKIYRREIIQNHNVRFESTRNVFSEDALFNLFFLYHASTASSVEGSYYNYFQQRNNSLMNSHKPDHLKREMFLVDRFAQYYEAYEHRDVYERILLRLFFERVQNSCVYSVGARKGIIKTWRELKQARLHEVFVPAMQKAASDIEVWMPMRIFARLCASGLFLPAGIYMHTFGRMQRLKKSITSRRNSAPEEVVPAQTA